MSNLLSFIKQSSSKHNDDYKVLKSAIKFVDDSRTKKSRKVITTKLQTGGVSYDKEAALEKFKYFDENLKNQSNEYQQLKAALEVVRSADGDQRITIDNFENEQEFDDALKKYSKQSSSNITIDTSDLTSDQTTPQTTKITQDTPSVSVEDLGDPNLDENSRKNKWPKPYDTLTAGTKLFHPSQDIKRFGESLIFVNLPSVLDKNEQRSFVMFFTPNEEYARRYSGMWSLNKRPVYVHEFEVVHEINGIKVIDPNVIPDNMENTKLAHGMCGPSEDGLIHGIKIEQPLNGDEKISEYYICRPEEYLKFIGSWMQFGSTEWVEIGKPSTIAVPDKQSKSNQEQLSVENLMVKKDETEEPSETEKTEETE
jgi:hypothetical protein